MKNGSSNKHVMGVNEEKTFSLGNNIASRVELSNVLNSIYPYHKTYLYRAEKSRILLLSFLLRFPENHEKTEENGCTRRIVHQRTIHNTPDFHFALVVMR